MTLPAVLMVLILLTVGGMVLLRHLLDCIDDDLAALARDTLKMNRAMIERVRALETRVAALQNEFRVATLQNEARAKHRSQA